MAETGEGVYRSVVELQSASGHREVSRTRGKDSRYGSKGSVRQVFPVGEEHETRDLGQGFSRRRMIDLPTSPKIGQGRGLVGRVTITSREGFSEVRDREENESSKTL